MRAILGSLLVVCGLGVASDEVSGAIPAENGVIVFASSRDGRADLYSIRADGTGETLVLEEPDTFDSSPSVSADGRIAFHVQTCDTTGCLSRIDVIDLAGMNRLSVIDGANSPAWSPDCTKLAFTRTEDIYVVDLLSGLVSQLTAHPGLDRDPAWSPDGTRIAFVSDRHGAPHSTSTLLYLMDADGSDLTRISEPDTLGALYESHPSWSPDGTRIALRSEFDWGENGYDRSEVWVVHLGTGDRTRVTRNAGMPDWSPDGTKIAYVSRIGIGNASNEIMVVGTDGAGLPTRLTNNTFEDFDPTWVPAGTACEPDEPPPPPPPPDAAADLTVSMADAPDPVHVGDRLSYTLVLRNHGPGTAMAAHLTGTLAGEVGFLSVATGRGSCSAAVPRLVDCDVGDLAAGDAVTIEIVVSALTAGSATSLATVDSEIPDPVPANNEAVTTSTIRAACTVEGTDGSDSLVGTDGDDVICAWGGNDSVDALAGDDIVYGGDGNDFIVGGDGDDLVEGEGGDDLLFGGDGNDVLSGGPGNDRAQFVEQQWIRGFPGSSRGDVVCYSYPGYPTVCVPAQAPNAPPGSQQPRRVVILDGGDDVIAGGDGDDELDDLTGDNSMSGDGGDDILSLGGGDDDVEGGEGDDQISAGAGSNRVNAGAGNDTVTAGGWSSPPATDSIDGGPGHDSITSSGGVDRLSGGEGDDTISGDGHLIGGPGNDKLRAGTGNDHLEGGEGDDLLAGGPGNDHLEGGGGDDRLYGQHGDDRLAGAAGDDEGYGGPGRDHIDGGDGDDYLHGDDPPDHIPDFCLPPLCTPSTPTEPGGHIHADVIIGGDGNDIVEGGVGDDELWGGRGVDELWAGKGNDRLFGESDPDKLFGEIGDDLLDGGDGDDVLLGDVGRDTLVGGNGRDTAHGMAGNDFLEMRDGAQDYVDGGPGFDRARVDLGLDTLRNLEGLSPQTDVPGAG